MSSCKQCVLTTPLYEVKIEGKENLLIFETIQEFLKTKGMIYDKQTQVCTVKETEMKDLYDFCADHFNIEQLSYRIDTQSKWQPFEGLLTVLETIWIDRIIKEERVVFYSQPIVDCDRNIYAHEMLARFVHEDNSLISPYEVFGAAKARNRLYALDKMCRMNAIRNAVYLPLPDKIFINFIPTSIYSPEHCLQSTIATSNKLGFPPSKFVFEVVESEHVEDLSHLKTILDFYREKGFYYALDDVGEGFNTLEVLQDLQPHYMKLDKSYVQGVAQSSSKQEVALTLQAAAKKVNAIALAEGIECEEDYIWLVEKGFQLFQGYYFGKPQPIER